ncbi:MAG TPA: hypothetical protein VEO74_05630 [Thermoanaerobaculia bacterium]|nr:hypothetical protein [Thermoanaerobaculia bacterium]
MATITVNLPDEALEELKETAAKSGGMDKFFENALSLAKVVANETRQSDGGLRDDRIVAIADKNGKVLKKVKFVK